MIHYEKKSVKLPRQNILLEAFHLLIFIYAYETTFLLHHNFEMSKGVAQHIFSLQHLCPCNWSSYLPFQINAVILW